MSSLIRINWNPTRKQLRQFGMVLVIGFGIIAIVLHHRHHLTGVYVAEGLAAIGGWAILFPAWALPFYKAWMGLAFVIGSVTSRILLAIIFYGVITPLGLFFRLRGRDTLKRKKPTESTYWLTHPEIDKANYEHLF